MVNGNYALYGDRQSTDSVTHEDHAPIKTDRKIKRKNNRTANELQHSLNLAQLDNETDSVKYEKKIMEPRLLRYIPTNDIEENYVTEQFETYDMKPSEERPRRFAFNKKPKNPADGSVNYAYSAYSRSSSACSSPNANLPTISEHTEQYGLYRVHAMPSSMGNDRNSGYDTKLDKYFSKPREVKKFAAKVGYAASGSHPDSLFRVQAETSTKGNRLTKVIRVLRWPVALITVCIALALFVYFLMPDNLDSNLKINGTYWEQQPMAAAVGLRGQPNKGSKPPEIDFNDATNAKNLELTPNKDQGGDLKDSLLVISPVFPTYLLPEVQYGNEQADLEKRKHKIFNHIQNGYTQRPHITQKPEKPLAVYFNDDNDAKPFTTETTIRTGKSVQLLNNVDYINLEHLAEPGLYTGHSSEINLNSNVNFTSGHSKFFGISIEDAARMKTTTQNALYNTRVSPTLPTWHDGDDSTTKKYTNNIYSEVQCKSTHLPLCREVLPYDIAGTAVKFGDVEITSMMPQIDYLIATNCSDRVKHFVCALLEPECSPPPLPVKLPCYNLCKAIVDNCDGHIPRELTLAFDCKMYSHTNCVDAKTPCYPREYTCTDGSCIPEDWICDGRKDCAAGDDEHKCKQCDSNEFKCPSGGCIQKRWMCDGYKDCPGGEDENELKCGTEHVLALEQPNGEPGEESAGSEPMAYVKQPSKANNDRRKSSGLRQNSNDNSKEILVTSYSNNAVPPMRTYTPSPERLSPYNLSTPSLRDRKPKRIQQKTAEESETRAGTEEPSEREQKTLIENDSYEASKTDDLGFFDELDNKSSDNKRPLGMSGPLMLGDGALPRDIPVPPTQLSLEHPKSTVEVVVDGASLLKKAQKVEAAETENLANLEKEDYPTEYKLGAHGSPCPSGELRCVDGHCITLAQLCDGTIDCSDHADEDNCFT